MRKLLAILATVLLGATVSGAGIVERQLDPEFAMEVTDGVYNIINATGGTLAANTVVYLCGWDEFYGSVSAQSYKICAADANTSGAEADLILTRAVANNTRCNDCAVKRTTLYNQNTNGLSEGAYYYLSETAGSITSTAPTAADSIVQRVGVVRTVSSTIGIIEIDIEHFKVTKIGSNELQAGAITPDAISVPVRNATGGTLTAPYVVYLSGWDETNTRYNITGADADAGDAVPPACVLLSNLGNNTNGTCYLSGRMTGVNTSAATAVGYPVYLSTTAGGWTLTAPTTHDDYNVIIGRVAVKDASTGAIEFDFINQQVLAIGANELEADSVTNTILANMTQGTCKVGGASNVPTDLDCNDTGKMLVGDGTDINSVDITGDIDVATNGATTIQAMAVEPTMEGLTCTNSSGGDYAAGDFVYFSSHSGTVLNCALADADVSGAVAQYVVMSACTNGSACVVARSGLITGVDTSAVGAVGDPLYLTVTGTTTNTWSATAPTGADDVHQVVARVTIDNASGAFLADLRSLPTISVGTNEYNDNSVTLAKLVDFTGQGYILRGGAAGVPEEANFSTAGYIGVGDGTTFTLTDFNDAGKIGIGTGTAYSSLALSGIIDLSAAGKVTRDARFRQFNFLEPAMLMLSDMTAVAAVADNSVNQMTYPEGVLFQRIDDATTAVAQTLTAYGIDFGLDNTGDEGIQISPPIHTSGDSFQGQTDAFYAKMTFRVEDASGTDPLALCFLTPQAYGDIDAVADLANYGGAGEEIVCIATGTGSGTDPAVIHQISNTNGGGIQNNAFTTSDYQCADGTTYTWEIDVAASGAVTFKVDGNAPGGGGAALTLTADEFFPLIVHISSADVNDNFYLSQFEYGLQ